MGFRLTYEKKQEILKRLDENPIYQKLCLDFPALKTNEWRERLICSSDILTPFLLDYIFNNDKYLKDENVI